MPDDYATDRSTPVAPVDTPQVSGEKEQPREVDRWLGTPEWEMALLLHKRLCRRDHQMDGCWGLNLPYDLNQPVLSGIQRRYIGLACGLLEAFDKDQINLILTMMDASWEPEQFPTGPRPGADIGSSEAPRD